MPRIIGLTGNIACGKTSVGQMLLSLGAERYIDADTLVHRLYEPQQPIALAIGRVFGSHVLTPPGSVDRAKLGQIVFHNAEAMQKLERLVHPAVYATLSQELALVSPSGIAVIDAVKLLEGASGKLCQSKWLVTCSPEQQITRLMTRNYLSLQEARTRLQAQPDTTTRLALVDEVIYNNDSLDQTHQQVVAAFARFCRLFPA
jgi:dephospho-CoA kinase